MLYIFPDGKFKCISVSENVWILITISLQFVFNVSLNIIPALAYIIT